ncbi:hypothetical protein BJX61DRAFT_27479 [Aspergillus egyptiacus]|nr:hypothetical protein BJX61DRAFT_27479 [Aspergillus egyptiacus]
MNPLNREPRPIPASVASRSKLSAFRYKNNDENRDEVKLGKTSPKKGHGNKENQTSWLNGVVEENGAKPDDQQHPQLTAEDTKAVKDCPQTPANRLPLADLIGNAEDALSREPVGQEFTPEDYVIWQHVPPSSNPSSQTPATQNRKRRHSSSPSSSPLAGTRGAHNGSFDLKSVQTLLKTPQNDLATDLWNNYVAKTTANVTDLQQPRFANLLSSSPHTPASARTGQGSSGLRRSNSCLAEWPSSKAKRRKIEGESHHKGRAIFSRSRSSVMAPRDSKATHFSSLVKNMERSLQQSHRRGPQPTEVSTSPVQHKSRRSRSASPLEARATNLDKGDAMLGDNVNDASRATQGRKTSQGSSSDFGDGDLDDDEFLELAEASLDPFVEPAQKDDSFERHHKEQNYALPSNNVDHSFDYMNQNLPLEADKRMPTKTDHALDIDEFDDDFDEFSDNINDILAECDETPSSKTSRTVRQQPPVSDYPPGQNGTGRLPDIAEEPANKTREQYATSSDEFDDCDFDMDCLDQAITQTEL